MASGLDTQRKTATQNRASLPGTQVLPELSNMPFEPGQVIHGKYEIIRLIGTGGVGFVVAARHIGFDDVVALKFLRPEFATNIEAVTRFTIEARASFKLRSEHVARVLDVDMFNDIPFIAMELLEGVDLRTLLDRCRVLPIASAIDCVLQTCEALAAAHAIGVIHRDIKPENLFLVGSGEDLDQLKVLDFGISKVALISNGRQTHQALTRIAVGTPPYMSPEQVRASSDLDARSDLWSVGCVLYELLTGTAPFDRISLMQSCAAVLEEEPAPPRDLRADIPEELSDVIMRCLRKDPLARFESVAELADVLSPYGSGRFAIYAARCRAFLSGEGPGRRSTPTAIAPVSRQITGTVPSTSTARRSIAVRLESNVPLTHRPSMTGASSLPSVRRPTYDPFGTANSGFPTSGPRLTRSPTAAPIVPHTRYEDPSVELPTLSLDSMDPIPKQQSARWFVLATAAVIGGLGIYYFNEQPRHAEHVVTLPPTPAIAAQPAPASPAPPIAAAAPSAAVAEVAHPAEAEAPTAAAADKPEPAAAVTPEVAVPEVPAAVSGEPAHAAVSGSSKSGWSSSKPAIAISATAARPSKPVVTITPAKPARNEDPDVGF